ncbi:hypothetical protein [Catelliglobosispora koreensis]|uniref:hypothetical protein n=1 Tax=Catelliglobosispora koreensis TaxID=129052 RepID=UPI00036C2159|nr:hypothetical protein [Catelliglobosispora koreensis]
MSTRTRLLRWLLIAAGCAALLYSLAGVVQSHDTRLAYLRFLALALTGHELVLIPLILGCGVLLARLTTARTRPVIQAAAIATLAFILIALPAILGYGRSSDLPSALPRDYGMGLLIIIATIWAAAGLALILRRRPKV